MARQAHCRVERNRSSGAGYLQSEALANHSLSVFDLSSVSGTCKRQIMASENESTEVYRPAFDTGYPHISYGLPFHTACAKHVSDTFQASRVYIIASGSLAKNTENVTKLQDALGSKVVGTRIGMKPHTLWSEILEIAKEAKDVDADILVTLGAGSLTDGAKIIALVGLRHSLPCTARMMADEKCRPWQTMPPLSQT